MRDDMLPRATQIYRDITRRLDDRYRAGTTSLHTFGIALAGLGVIGGLVASQIYVTRRTNRMVNPALLVATVLIAIAVGWTVSRLVTSQDALVRAQREGSDPVQVLAAARILTLRAESASSLAVIEREPTDLDSVIRPIGGDDGRGGVLGEAAALVPSARRAGLGDQLVARYTSFVTALNAVQDRLDGGSYDDAVALAVGDQAEATRLLDLHLQTEIDAAQARFTVASADARGGFTILGVALTATMALAGVLVLVGLQRRIGEYR
jgi:hypothetical protein